MHLNIVSPIVFYVAGCRSLPLSVLQNELLELKCHG